MPGNTQYPSRIRAVIEFEVPEIHRVFTDEQLVDWLRFELHDVSQIPLGNPFHREDLKAELIDWEIIESD